MNLLKQQQQQQQKWKQKQKQKQTKTNAQSPENTSGIFSVFVHSVLSCLARFTEESVRRTVERKLGASLVFYFHALIPVMVGIYST